MAQQETYVSTEFNNIAITPDNFIYVTTNNIEASDRRAAVSAKNGKYSPVKLLNPSGDEVMIRTGFWDPGGNLTGTYEYVDEYTLLVSLDNSGSDLNYACAFAEDEDGVTMVLMNDDTGYNGIYFMQ